MSFLLCGLDEAGYGPTLGPLVVGFASLRAKLPLAPGAPWKLLAPPVTRRRAPHGFPVADSKTLYKSAGQDLSLLEGAVLAFLSCERAGVLPKSFRELAAQLTGGGERYLDDYPWYRGADLPLPVHLNPLELAGFSRQLARRLSEHELEVHALRARPLEVADFNRGLDQDHSKGEVNAQEMGHFLKDLWQHKQSRNVEVWSDRLGGRQRYGSFLYPLFPGCDFDILKQGVERQSYRATANSDGRMITVHYTTEGEKLSFLTALASMTAKYFRELHMMLFNRWWRTQMPGLRPTAGYPEDARRFLAEIDPIRSRQGIDPALLIRRK